MRVRILPAIFACALPSLAVRAQEDIPLPGDPAAPDFAPLAEEILPDGTPPGPAVAPRISPLPVEGPKSLSEKGGQFHIHNGDAEQRRRLLQAAGLVRREVLASLRLPDQWVHPIVIEIRDALSLPRDADPVWTSILQIPGGFRIEVNVAPVRGSVPGLMLREHIVRAVLAEWILRGSESRDLDGVTPPPPDWLLHGTLELLDYREMGRPSDTFSTVFQLGHVLSVDEILNADAGRMDSVSRGIFRASCCGLIMMLQAQPHFSRRMPELLRSLATPGDETAALIFRAFPELSTSANSIGKWWSLQVASLAEPDSSEIRSPQETEQSLAEALVLRFPASPPGASRGGISAGLRKLFGKRGNRGEKASGAPAEDGSPPAETVTCDISEVDRYLSRSDRAEILTPVRGALLQCQMRAHPLYSPVIREYQEVISNLIEDRKVRESVEALSRLATVRANLGRNIREIEDFLNWYEVTSLEQPSGLFSEYLRVAGKYDPEHSRSSRNDPITRYMDAMEAELESPVRE